MKLFILFSILLYSININSQGLIFRVNLADRLDETSGIVKENSNSFWTHNDSGDLPIIFNIDSNGVIIDSVFIDSATHVDFEDIAKDNAGNYYIADCGNNPHNRTDLTIYKITNPSLAINNRVIAEKISFNYPDQTTFPDTNKNVDCEAIVHLNNNIYLFTKNHGASGYSKLYKVPDTAGNYNAILLDSILFNGQVTGADISSTGTLAILGMGSIHLYDNFIADDFFNGTHTQFPIPFSQTEAICFVNPDKLFITQEDNNFFPVAKLFEFSISKTLYVSKIDNQFKTTVFPNPAKEFIKINLNNSLNENIVIKIFNTIGILFSQTNRNVSEEVSINVSSLKAGIYYLEIQTDKYSSTTSFIKK